MKYDLNLSIATADHYHAAHFLAFISATIENVLT